MNFYEIVSEEFTKDSYWNPPETERLFDVVFAPTRSKAKYKFFKKYRRHVGAKSFKDFLKVSIRKIDFSNNEDREYLQEVVFSGEVLT